MSKNDEVYAQAVDKYLAGDMSAASKLCQKLLVKNQKDDRALNLFGLVQQFIGNGEQAKNFFLKATKQNPKNIEALTNLANLYQLQKEYAPALEIYDKIITQKPDFAKGYYNAALALIELGDVKTAKELLIKTIDLEPEFIDGHINLGNIYKKEGNLSEAYVVISKARTLLNSPRLDLSLALICGELKNFDEARALVDVALSKDRSAEALNDKGIVYYQARLYDEAVTAFLEALSIKKDFSSCYCNLANALLDKGDEHLAKGALLKAIALEPNSADSYVNYGVYAKKICDIDGAKEAFTTALRLNPTCAAAATNLGILYMLEGDFSDGLRLYESRKKPFIDCNKPLYHGQDLTDKTLFVYHEQGFGDTINFARLLKHHALLKGRILFLPQKELFSLFDADKLGVKILSSDEVLEGSFEFDYHTPLLSLLYVLDISLHNIPPSNDYFCIDEAKVSYFKDALSNTKEKKIGIAWQGNKEYSGDKERSITLELFEPLLEKGYALVAINKDFDMVEFRHFADGKSVFEFTKELNSFRDTASLLECLDFVVTIDTSVAHLSASKNIPTFILLPKIADWRWGMGGDSTPWYGALKLLRQESRGDWKTVFDKLLFEF